MLCWAIVDFHLVLALRFMLWAEELLTWPSALLGEVPDAK